MRAATHEKHVQEPVPVDVSNPRVDVSNLRAPMFPALRRKTTVQILILILTVKLESGGKGRAKLKKVSCMQWGCGEQDT